MPRPPRARALASVPIWDYHCTNASDCRGHVACILGESPRCRAGLESLASGGDQRRLDTTGHIKAQFRNASVLKNRRVVFNIKGNDYRLVVAVAYKLQVVYVKFVGTHAQYDAIDAQTIAALCPTRRAT